MEKILLQIIICSIIGYFVGCINPAFIIANIKGFDIRDKGSGNAGASNAGITMGKATGVLCALFDILKAFFTVKICFHFFPLLKVIAIIAGVCTIIGHIYPIFMNFQGGKGLACLGGVILAVDYKFFFILLLAEFIIALIIDYICIVPTSGSFIFMIYLLIKFGFVYALAFLPAVIIIFLRHVDNFLRIRYGIEAHFSYMWNKEKDIQRIHENWLKLSEKQQRLLKTTPSTLEEDLHK